MHGTALPNKKIEGMINEYILNNRLNYLAVCKILGFFEKPNMVSKIAFFRKRCHVWKYGEFQETALSFRESSNFFVIFVEEEKRLVNLHRERNHKSKGLLKDC